MAAIFGNPNALAPPDEKPKRLSFDEQHFEKFLREDNLTKQDGQEELPIQKRKRQNPLGDFKLKRINDYF